MTWGIETDVVERFERAGVEPDRIDFAHETYNFNYPESPTEVLAAFRSYYGPTMNAFEAANASGRMTELQNELEALFNSKNTSPDATTTSIPATYLRVTVTV
jgi:hypothetical protein